MVPWIRQWKGAGFGLMGEQGAESIHAEFNRLEIRHRNQRHDRVEASPCSDRTLDKEQSHKYCSATKNET